MVSADQIAVSMDVVKNLKNSFLLLRRASWPLQERLGPMVYNIARIVDVKPPYVNVIRRLAGSASFTKPQFGKAGNDPSFRVTIDAQLDYLADTSGPHLLGNIHHRHTCQE